jgi:tyrosyl-tRNA synthetase
MNTEEKIELIKQVGEEIITEDDLRALLESKPHPIAYDGFEPSGRIHIAQGVMRAINVNKLTKAGIKFKFLAADWHAWANNKLGGDLEKIQTCGDYLIEVWKACGMDMNNVEFVRSSDVVSKDTYWKTVLRIARENTVSRITRCAQIMGRQESESLSAAQIFYPCMQAADIFELGVDIAQLGMDQRKVNMLAREIGLKLGFWKPIAVHHHMLMGLCQPPATDAKGAERAIELKMSKSKPDTAIFMDDSTEEIARKIRKAYCPEKQIQDNPIFEYCKYIVFEKFDILKIERPAKFGGDMVVKSIGDLEDIYVKGELFPLDLKNAVADHIDKILVPVREHFEKNQKAKDLLKEVKSFEITR